MAYVVYHDKQHRRAMIHRETCNHYRTRDAQATYRPNGRLNGQWVGLFASFSLAEAYATGVERRVVYCMHCMEDF